MNKTNSKLNEEWKQKLSDIDKVYVFALNKNISKFTIYFVNEKREIEAIEPYSTNKKELPFNYTIASNGDKFFYAYGGGYNKAAEVINSLKMWLGKEKLSYERMN